MFYVIEGLRRPPDLRPPCGSRLCHKAARILFLQTMKPFAALREVFGLINANLIRAFQKQAKIIMQNCVITLDCEILLLSFLRSPSFCPVPKQRLLRRLT